jgi:hypothetical protein
MGKLTLPQGYIVVRDRTCNIPSEALSAEDVSDGYHTFKELYDHRAALTAALWSLAPPGQAWKSWLHHDGTMFEGMFIAGLDLPTGQVSYHYNADRWQLFYYIPEVERAPKYDGHTSEDVISRLVQFAWMQPGRK